MQKIHEVFAFFSFFHSSRNFLQMRRNDIVHRNCRSGIRLCSSPLTHRRNYILIHLSTEEGGWQMKLAPPQGFFRFHRLYCCFHRSSVLPVSRHRSIYIYACISIPRASSLFDSRDNLPTTNTRTGTFAAPALPSLTHKSHDVLHFSRFPPILLSIMDRHPNGIKGKKAATAVR